jgi:hypothetical protein
MLNNEILIQNYEKLTGLFYMSPHTGIHTLSYYKVSPGFIIDSRHDTGIKTKPPTTRSVSNAFVHEYT